MMRGYLLASCMAAAILLLAPQVVLGTTYLVNAAGDSDPNWTVQGTIEFDGVNYLDWNLVSDASTHGGQFNYTPMNSTLAASSPFFTSTNLGAENFALDAPGASPDAGFLWLRFATPLTSLPPGGTTLLPGIITVGSCDSRFEQSINNWWYVRLEGVVLEEGAVPTMPSSWAQFKRWF